jgi:hypothetical protein
LWTCGNSTGPSRITPSRSVSIPVAAPVSQESGHGFPDHQKIRRSHRGLSQSFDDENRRRAQEGDQNRAQGTRPARLSHPSLRGRTQRRRAFRSDHSPAPHNRVGDRRGFALNVLRLERPWRRRGNVPGAQASVRVPLAARRNAEEPRMQTSTLRWAKIAGWAGVASCHNDGGVRDCIDCRLDLARAVMTEDSSMA